MLLHVRDVVIQQQQYIVVHREREREYYISPSCKTTLCLSLSLSLAGLSYDRNRLLDIQVQFSQGYIHAVTQHYSLSRFRRRRCCCCCWQTGAKLFQGCYVNICLCASERNVVVRERVFELITTLSLSLYAASQVKQEK